MVAVTLCVLPDELQLSIPGSLFGGLFVLFVPNIAVKRRCRPVSPARFTVSSFCW